MAEDKRANPYPYPTAQEVEAAPGSREKKAARNIAVRHMAGIPIRAFLLGQNDDSPMMRGIVDLTTGVYELLDLVNSTPRPVGEDGGSALDTAARRVHDMLEHHGCPKAKEN